MKIFTISLLILTILYGGAAFPLHAEEGGVLKVNLKNDLRERIMIGENANLKVENALEAQAEAETKKHENRSWKKEFNAELKSDAKLYSTTSTTTVGDKEKGWLHAPGILKKIAFALGFTSSTTPMKKEKDEKWKKKADNDYDPAVVRVKAFATATSSAHVFWLTNEFTSSTLYYSNSGPVVIASSTPSVVLAKSSMFHHVKLDNLSASTSYRYRILSTDREGNTSLSGELIFRTNASTN